MPERSTVSRAQKQKREGKAPTTQAGEFVREEMEHMKEGKHPVKSPKQAIAIGLSKARRAGVKLAAPKRAKPKTRASAASASRAGKKGPLARTKGGRRGTSTGAGKARSKGAVKRGGARRSRASR